MVARWPSPHLSKVDVEVKVDASKEHPHEVIG